MSELARVDASGDTRPGRRRRFTVDALFADTTPRAVGVSDLVDAKEIRLDRIAPDPRQPRQSFDEERLRELAASIRLEGVLQPIAVRYLRDEDRYVILHGERRWRAAAVAGLTSIPAVVREVPEERRLIQQLMENVVREDLNAVDRAAALRALKAQMGDASWEAVAEAVGIRRSRLFQLLGTEKLPDTVQDAIRSGRLSEKQSRVLQGLASGPQEALAHLIVDEGLGPEEARRLARAMRDDPDFIDLKPHDLAERLRGMRRIIEPDADAAPDEDQFSRALRAVLGDDADAEPGEPPADDALDTQVQALARSLSALSAAPLPRGRRAAAQTRLRSLRRLIDAAITRLD